MDKKNIPRKGLPENAKLVFKGVIFEVWQWEQKMFDGTNATFEKVWRFPTVEIIATVGDKILFEKQTQPDRDETVNLVSGRGDEGETPLESAKRELLEETGYISDNWNLILEHQMGTKVLHDIYYYVAKDCRKIQEPNLDAGEKIETKLITFEELIDLSQNPRFWVASQFVNILTEARYDEKKKENLRKSIFEE